MACLHMFGNFANIAYSCYMIFIYKKGDYMLIYVGIVAFIVLVVGVIVHKFSSLEDDYQTKIKKADEDKQMVIRDYEKRKRQLGLEYQSKYMELKKREDIIQFILSDSYPFRDVASLREDMELLLYDEKRKILMHKTRPALKAAEEVKLLKKKTKGYIAQYKEMKYRYDYLLQIFPQLERYVGIFS